ncbi:MAG TPA: putative metal-binding motif-containing protein [Kofleriaceae bacterium]
MKSALLVGIALVAGCGSDNGGVFLDLTATAHFDSANVEIVLASADDAKIALDVQQRLDPKVSMDSPVDYYRQRATGGMVATTTIDGFTVKIEPDDSVAPDELFVPIVLVHGPDGQITAIGTVEDATGALFKMPVRSEQPSFYTMNVRPLVPSATASTDPVVTGDAHYCKGSDDGDVISGVVWTSPGEKQRRLLLPKSGTTDASEQPFDIDCDGIAADGSEPDCDDLDATTHPGATEACDGIDSACDGNGYVIVPCVYPAAQACATDANPNGTTMTGLALCSEGDGTTPRQLGGTQGCVLPPMCTNVTPIHGATCKLSSTAESGSSIEIESCSAAVAPLTVCTGSCPVEVGPIFGDLEADIASSQGGNYDAQGVATSGKIYLRVKDNTQTYMRPSPTYLGRVLLVVNSASVNATVVYAVNITLDANAAPVCDRPANGDAAMLCSQM